VTRGEKVRLHRRKVEPTLSTTSTSTEVDPILQMLSAGNDVTKPETGNDVTKPEVIRRRAGKESEEERDEILELLRAQCYKTFYCRNLRMFVKS
jgi:hypothetical protein